MRPIRSPSLATEQRIGIAAAAGAAAVYGAAYPATAVALPGRRPAGSPGRPLEELDASPRAGPG